MQLDEYQALAGRTLRNADRIEDRMASCALGLTGEAGEVGDYCKKILFHGHPLDRDKLRDELGDVLWYVAALASVCDLSLDAVAEQNIAKLRRRYPDGFTSHDSIRRVDTEDR